MQYMLLDSGASCVVTVKKVIQTKPLSLQTGPTLCLDDEDLILKIESYPNTNGLLTPQHNTLAYIVYTSGTTGKPKGVTVTHASLFNLIADIRWTREIEFSDRVLLFSPLCFDASIRDITGAMMIGASLYVPQEEEILPGSLMKTIALQQITNSVITPSVLRSCTLEHLPDFKTLVLAGEAADRHLIETWGAGRRLVNAYGPTEATVCSTKQVYYDGRFPPGRSASNIGKPVLNTTISIVDEKGSLVKHGTLGEIWITGPGVSCRGYLNLPHLNKDRYKNNPYCRYRSYKTGDLGRITPDGDLECLGRQSCTRQIKLNGQRIQLEEVEHVIRSAGHVSDVVVLTQGVAPTQRLCAYVVPAPPKSDADCQALRSRLVGIMRENLPSYSIPGVIEFLDAFPLTINRKLDVKALPGLTSEQGKVSQLTGEQILTPSEKHVAVALLEALDLPVDQAVTPSTKYGELGGNSLQATLVLRHLNKSLGCKIQLGQFYRNNISIRQITELLSGEQKEQTFLSPAALRERTILPHDVVYNGSWEATFLQKS
ncbi:MAG: hypothetical protein Q9209_004723 [Squamulea sp. 1 TL-2023]